MKTARNNNKDKPSKNGKISRKLATSSVVSVRISDEDKEQINKIMKASDINSYSDFMRMALQMVRLQLLSGSG